MHNKKLLVLGGTSAATDVVEVAHSMGAYVIVADDKPQNVGVAKKIADYSVQISTLDHNGLVDFIRQESVDGVFCGPSEFNLQNCLKVCELADLPFYCTQKQWDICSNKDSFKKMCQAYGIAVVPGYEIDGDIETVNLSQFDYPVMVKPAAGCSSVGIIVCHSAAEVRKAYITATNHSSDKKAIIEKYIDNESIGISVRYIASDGDIYLSAVGDRYVVDAREGGALISSVALFPSKYTQKYLDEIDTRVKIMFHDLGIQNASLFMQALVDVDGNIYFHEMGLRLSGGLTYKMTEPLNGVNDMKMMIRYALGGQFCTKEEKNIISPWLGGKYAGSLTLPLRTGTITNISGIHLIKSSPFVVDFAQYYTLGDEILPSDIGTLMQLFGRVKMIADKKEDIIDTISFINSSIEIQDQNGQDMMYNYFDVKKLQESAVEEKS